MGSGEYPCSSVSFFFITTAQSTAFLTIAHTTLLLFFIQSSALQTLEERHQGANILLVSHNDTLTILMATMEGEDLRHHRKFDFETAQLKKLRANV